MRDYTTTTMRRIGALHDERLALWSKVGRGEKLSAAEQGRLLDIATRLESLWRVRRQEKARAKAASPLDSGVQTPYSPGRARASVFNRRGRALRLRAH